MPHADVNGLSLHYVREGPGPPLLLIMGMSGHHASWGERFPALLAQSFDVIRFDNRGMGRSGRAQAPFTVSDMAADAAGLLDALGVGRAHVMGISLGGAVAQELALSHLQRVDRLVLGCTFAGGTGRPPSNPASVQALLEAMRTRDLGEIMRVGHAINYAGHSPEPEAGLGPHSDRALAERAPVEVTLLQAQAGAAHDAAARLAELAAPALVLHGREDALIPAGEGERLAALIPGARLVVLERAGHLFFIEWPEQVAELVRGHLLDQ